MKKKIRDSAYWLGRLEREHPDIYADHRAGKISSVREACIRARLIRQPTRLDALKREWKKTGYRDRKAFVDWILW